MDHQEDERATLFISGRRPADRRMRVTRSLTALSFCRLRNLRLAVPQNGTGRTAMSPETDKQLVTENVLPLDLWWGNHDI